MKSTLVGQLITADGWNAQSYFSDDPADLWNPIRRKRWVIPAAEVRSVQAPEIPLRAHHGSAPIGRITHLERRALDGSLWAVAELDADVRPLPDRDYFLSVEATWSEGTPGTDVEIRGVALCEKSAMVGLRPVTFVRDGLDQRGRSLRRLGSFPQGLLTRASEARYQRRRSEPVRVHDEPLDDGDLDHLNRLSTPERMQLFEDQAWKHRPLEIRPGRIIAVR